MATPGEDRIMKTYHGAQDGWLEEAVKTQAVRPPHRSQGGGARLRLSRSDESGLMTGSNIDFDQMSSEALAIPPLEP